MRLVLSDYQFLIKRGAHPSAFEGIFARERSVEIFGRSAGSEGTRPSEMALSLGVRWAPRQCRARLARSSLEPRPPRAIAGCHAFAAPRRPGTATRIRQGRETAICLMKASRN